MAVDKLGVYNDALQILGERRLSSLTEDREPRHRLDHIYDFGAVDYCLEIIKPRFACRTTILSDLGPSASTDFQFTFNLPADYVALAGIFSDGNLSAPIGRYIVQGNELHIDHQSPYLRYVSNDAAFGIDFTLWTPSFARVVSSYLAKELAPRIRPDMAEKAMEMFTEASKLAVDLNKVEEPMPRARKPTATINQDWLNVYNEALMLCGFPYLLTDTDDSENRAFLDAAVSQNLVESQLEDTNWHWARVSDKLFFNPSLEPDWGWEFVFDYPPDLYRLTGVFHDEFLTAPLKEYSDEGRRIFTHVEEIYVEYVPDQYVSNPSAWPAYFKRLIAAELAMRIGPVIKADMALVMERWKDIRAQAFSNDAMQSEPRKILRGQWTRVRTQGDSRRQRP